MLIRHYVRLKYSQSTKFPITRSIYATADDDIRNMLKSTAVDVHISDNFTFIP